MLTLANRVSHGQDLNFLSLMWAAEMIDPLAGVVGDDEPGNRLRKLLDAHGIESHVWVDRRPTTWKQRIVTRGQLRPDRCDREVTTPVSDPAERFLGEVPLGDILLAGAVLSGAPAFGQSAPVERAARYAASTSVWMRMAISW